MKPKTEKQGNESERLRTTFGPVEEKQQEDTPPTKMSKKGTLSRESSKQQERLATGSFQKQNTELYSNKARVLKKVDNNNQPMNNISSFGSLKQTQLEALSMSNLHP